MTHICDSSRPYGVATIFVTLITAIRIVSLSEMTGRLRLRLWPKSDPGLRQNGQSDWHPRDRNSRIGAGLAGGLPGSCLLRPASDSSLGERVDAVPRYPLLPRMSCQS